VKPLTLGVRLREVRQARQRTLADVAKDAQISTGYLSEIERDIRLPPLDTLARIGKSLNTSVVGILSGIKEYT
jgi:transcriptional regulator with XRE-family HTH domain